MSRNTFVVTFGIVCLLGIGRGQTLRGDISNAGPLGGDTMIVLCNPVTGEPVQQEFAGPGGAFQFHDLSSGPYLLRIVGFPSERVISSSGTASALRPARGNAVSRKYGALWNWRRPRRRSFSWA